ncbi:MAG: hypothetical protein MJ198_00890 [Bacteroidales bacterium]|nr:hypothetical protein [Bacteroidales bacterium]
MRKFLLATIGIIFSISIFAQNQNEFKIYGKIKAVNSPAEGVTIKVTQRGYKYKEVTTDAKGAYELYLPYGKNFVITYNMDGYQTLTFEANLELPSNAPQCCYRPMEISYHLFNPEDKYKHLFNKTFHVIAYEKQFKGFNYDLDIDYMVQQRIVNTELFEQQLELAHNGAEKNKDSIKVEKRYMALINQGSVYYDKSQFYAARKFFTEATKIKPKRLYAYYKLEDIKTEIERFETKAELLGINLDSLIAQELAKIDESEEGPKTYPAYVPLTDQQVEEIFRTELQKQVYASSSNIAEGNRTMRLMDEFFSEETKKNTAIAQTEPKKKEKKKKTEEVQQQVVAKEEPKPEPKAEPIDLSQKPKPVVKTEATKKVVDFVTYQDSLMQKYPNERTIEITQDAHKKTTRVFMNDGKRVEIYTMVEHSWGATYYFLEEYPTGTTSIGYAAFVNKTKLTDLNNIQATQPAGNQ